MTVTRAIVWGGCLLMLAATVNAQSVTVQHTADYHDTYDDIYGPDPSWTGIWFIPPVDITYVGEYILDHTPYHRGSGEDWYWAHDLTGLEPTSAIGIASATLTIVAWDVDGHEEVPEEDMILAKLGPDDHVELGLLKGYMEAPVTIPWNYEGQPGGTLAGLQWSSTTFILPSEVLDSIWINGRLDVKIDIDRVIDFVGHRVTLKHATLTVDYVVSGEPMEPNLPVYRFWVPVSRSHFYTAKESEKEKLINTLSGVYVYEGIGFYVYAAGRNPDIKPVYRFWSSASKSHFYTIKVSERDKLLNYFASYWTYEGVAFYAHPVGLQPLTGSAPVHRFYHKTYRRHFFTSKESEKQKLLDQGIYTYEGIAWYAYNSVP